MGLAAVNPIATIVTMADSLQLDSEQVTRLEAVGRELQSRQNRLQEEMMPQMMQAFQRDPQSAMQALQPRLEQARQQLIDAVAEAEKILTPEQWEQVPSEIKEPPQLPAGLGGQRGPGGQMRGVGGQRGP
jgi:esterase/lipase